MQPERLRHVLSERSRSLRGLQSQVEQLAMNQNDRSVGSVSLQDSRVTLAILCSSGGPTSKRLQLSRRKGGIWRSLGTCYDWLCLWALLWYTDFNIGFLMQLLGTRRTRLSGQRYSYSALCSKHDASIPHPHLGVSRGAASP